MEWAFFRKAFPFNYRSSKATNLLNFNINWLIAKIPDTIFFLIYIFKKDTVCVCRSGVFALWRAPCLLAPVTQYSDTQYRKLLKNVLHSSGREAGLLCTEAIVSAGRQQNQTVSHAQRSLSSPSSSSQRGLREVTACSPRSLSIQACFYRVEGAWLVVAADEHTIGRKYTSLEINKKVQRKGQAACKYRLLQRPHTCRRTSTENRKSNSPSSLRDHAVALQ